MITIYPECTEIKNSGGINLFENLAALTGLKVSPFSCARAALVYGLRALGIGRMDEVLVPPFLSYCVLSALTRSSFASMSASSRTKAILVFHQFGYPQKIEQIRKAAVKNKWVIINNCSNTIFSSYRGEFVLRGGGFSVLSLSKIFGCILGGGLVSERPEMLNSLKDNYPQLFSKHLTRANIAYDTLNKFKNGLLGFKAGFEVDAVFGYLPEVVSIPTNTLAALPGSIEEIKNDTAHRKRLLKIVSNKMPGRIPVCRDEEEVVPFAIPVIADTGNLEKISRVIRKELEVEAPILHFDYSRNMLDPDYRRSLVIGCHKDWTEEIVEKICNIVCRYA